MAEERFFTDADLLVGACAGRASALEQAGLSVQAEQSLCQGSGRVRAYLLTELSELINYRRSRGISVSVRLQEISQRWQGICQEKIGAGLSRALKAARGQAITVGRGGGEVAVTGPAASTQSGKPAMSLAAWLDNENADLSPLAPERLMVAAQFSWVRDSIGLEQTEPPTPLERAEQIIGLAEAYQSSAQASPATAQALWQLGSFMGAMGYQAEAWDCLGQAAGMYSGLAQALLPLPQASDSQEDPSEQKQRDCYAYRAAALAALAEAAAISGDDPLWAKCSASLAAETRAKLAQLRRGCPGISKGGEEPPEILSVCSHALRVVGELTEAKAYGRQRTRFWWWHYPQDVFGEEVSAGSGRSTRQPGRSTRPTKALGRPKLEYVEPKLRNSR